MSERIQTLDEQRIRAFLKRESVSETAGSLAMKLSLNVYVAQRVLDCCAEAGELSRQRFGSGEAVYTRSAPWSELRAS